MDMGGSIDDTFLIPSSDGWKSTAEKKDANVTTTFARTLAAGVPLKGDLSIKGEGGKPMGAASSRGVVEAFGDDGRGGNRQITAC